MDFNWLGVAFVADDVPNKNKIELMIADKADELREKAQEEFDAFLDGLGLEQAMGVIVPKTSRGQNETKTAAACDAEDLQEKALAKAYDKLLEKYRSNFRNNEVMHSDLSDNGFREREIDGIMNNNPSTADMCKFVEYACMLHEHHNSIDQLGRIILKLTGVAITDRNLLIRIMTGQIVDEHGAVRTSQVYCGTMFDLHRKVKQ